MNPIQQALEALKPLAEVAEFCEWKNENDDIDNSAASNAITYGYLRAARTAYEALSKYQDGWVLVPREITPEIKRAFLIMWGAKNEQEFSEWGRLAQRDWDDLLAASARQHMEGG